MACQRSSTVRAAVFSEPCLELCEGHFDRVEIGTVRRQIVDLRAGCSAACQGTVVTAGWRDAGRKEIGQANTRPLWVEPDSYPFGCNLANAQLIFSRFGLTCLSAPRHLKPAPDRLEAVWCWIVVCSVRS
jgi:hypothetical protein